MSHLVLLVYANNILKTSYIMLIFDQFI